MREAASFSETSVNFYPATRRNNPEDFFLLAALGTSNLSPIDMF
jgi:hypothetical protein